MDMAQSGCGMQYDACPVDCVTIHKPSQIATIYSKHRALSQPDYLIAASLCSKYLTSRCRPGPGIRTLLQEGERPLGAKPAWRLRRSHWL